MLRPTMAALITQTRVLISDTGNPPIFSDDQVQNALDPHRVEQRWVPLRPQPTFLPGGQVVYLDYYSSTGWWEDDIIIQNLAYVTINSSLSVSEPIVGHWSFPSQPTGIGVRATGKTYDLYAASADLLDAWAAQVKLDFTFVSKQDQYLRNQKFAMIKELSLEYRKRAMPHVARLIQSDAAPDHDGGGVTYPSLGDTGYGP